MLKKRYRLKNSTAFNATYQNHNVVSDKNICIYLGKEKTDLSFDTKIAFVVSKKIHKRAVIRNRIKRLMRENIRLAIKNNDLTNINNYLSLILVAKHGAVGASFNELKSSVYWLLSQ